MKDIGGINAAKLVSALLVAPGWLKQATAPFAIMWTDHACVKSDSKDTRAIIQSHLALQALTDYRALEANANRAIKCVFVYLLNP